MISTPPITAYARPRTTPPFEALSRDRLITMRITAASTGRKGWPSDAACHRSLHRMRLPAGSSLARGMGGTSATISWLIGRITCSASSRSPGARSSTWPSLSAARRLSSRSRT